MATYQTELDLFKNEVEQKQPNDFLQFAANYFTKRLEQQRTFVRNQESLALSKGIVLFPSTSKHDSVAASSASLSHGSSKANASQSGISSSGVDEDVLFKSPFVDRGPHSTHIVDHLDSTHSNTTASPAKASGGDAPGIFKGNFNVGTESQRKVNSSVDPMAPEPTATTHSFPRRSVVNPKPLPINFNAQRRTSVSGETLQPDHLDDWKPENFQEKSPEQVSRLEKAVGKNFLFNKLDSDSKKLVINSLEEKSIPQGKEIIKQGDEGDYFYIVEDGTVEFYVNNQKVNTSGPGSSFGELALMYNSPRAATVIASTDCILWALDRLTFRRILLGGSFKKRILYDDLLKNIPILKSLSTYDRAKLADALDTEYYEAGQTIIKEGDTGENFYFIEYGEADVSQEGKGVITKLGKGDYFGEVALLNDLPRQATVTATARTKVATLGKSGFQRLLGPVVDVLKLNDPTRSKH
ncbi:cAMP-dependent protein kinase regulatory subunit BCY1 [Kluyveromyces lactis]|uniref:cAMP-dependent protein kinase regulatory subunit n=1 Tax=Kluyveromyces lactis (strain ATCC 8585 / CBS 2359 / DSM 70799 / NBRC 1267 / NRRL Y-1140 / WM37) TaxID=284590 RepID=KAPR_KLULA|nr:uncharacterized protein KLLA0_E04181g [Kluyveromyces lactis]Q6CPK7.1 RecName: Full=cAMP-dependent protein kinase regulatory subunit; Short=PKA regulatory subunit [Kluyveromyces lactis NRRL Y-1140]CAG99219.1 KLLA0E04181p [Kluyveromyces lactis]|eukprot:XP_454132.1 uncharacterized protein KLLA0_E04181g [Kluyveromyces lactis]